ncbi:unnamed protein product (mitochondrion) [Plasmodiophora brassicae]|uniref:V-type proton ATPase subunit E n=1 Tax=Plasmodiophora brassicae TaxID=37360 RepID=A0A0G4J8P3_PLABS|nr:hypothetical protein PBRA_003321 [Plasmodiophora brassicae]SPQ99675.1 unnamed protein product [Plasmodiophora brassicae]
MNPTEAARQISQMVEFIKQEAREKAEEIRVKTDQEFNIAKLSLIEAAKQQIANDFVQLRKEKIANQKIARSGSVQQSRQERLQHQQATTEKIRSAALERLVAVPNDPAYEKLLIALIVQGLVRLREDHVVIRCRNEDAAIVKKCLPKATSFYSDIVKRDVGKPHNVTLELDTNGLVGIAGGVELLAQNNKILLSNTLNSRLSLCFDDLKPVIRSVLFDI